MMMMLANDEQGANLCSLIEYYPSTTYNLLHQTESTLVKQFASYCTSMLDLFTDTFY